VKEIPLYLTVSTLKPTIHQTNLTSNAIRTNGGDGGDNLTELQLEENRGLTSGIQADHEDTHILLGPPPIKQTANHKTHLGCSLG
jgi:hypothetical protein